MVIALQVKGLTKEYDNHMVLNNISFEVDKGEVFGIIGMSGSGKTTLLNHLIGFITPDEGHVLYADKDQLKDINKSFRDVTSKFGFAPQTPSFYPKLTVYENLVHFGVLHKLKRKDMEENIKQLLNITRLEPHKNKLSEHLSGGMQRRLSIMCGLIHKPEVLILDEPTADLDPILREDTWHFIKQVNKLGTTIIVASHFLHELETSCTKVAIINDGKLLKYGTVKDLKKEFSKNSIELHIDTESKNFSTILNAIDKNKVTNVKKKENKLIIYTLEPQEALYEIAKLLKSKKITAHALYVHRPSLREVFETLTR